MSFSRAASEAPVVPPRSPVHIAAKEPSNLRHTSPGPGLPPSAKETPISIASALLPSTKPTSASAEREKERESVGKGAAEKKPQTPEPELEDDGSEVIEMETFEQILELDEDDTHDFSFGMVVAYFSQASQTFNEMDEALKAQDLEKLSQLGHFLKGSSAALGVAKVQATCEIIQHLGKMREDERPISQTDALNKLRPLLARVKKEYAVAESWLRNFYEEQGLRE
ncbi:histidine-phosphotransfer domain HPT domain-containing protein [Cristinia sonorae]|uniref:Histidine-phosphotransfer domain HPT domain-containing protein n=1 Tax=Cristinia sonorae TaxID=1940300 RepID=A0A8K0UGF6_9AGAR|nr:histidine-phosphotransfer domain HPT domain-containing protein [Cristinia sonorae]